VWPARSAGRGGALVQGRPGAAAGCGSGAALAASVEGRNSWHAMSVFTRSARWLTAGSVPRLNTDQRAGEQAAHSLFMPERMQLLIVTSISCVLQPAAQTQLVSSHGTVRRRRDTLREQAKRAAAQFARAGNALLRILRPPAARKLCGHRTQLDRWHGSVPGQWVIGRPPGEDDGMHAGRDVLHHDHACLLVIRRRPLRAGASLSPDLLTCSQICRSAAALAPHAAHWSPHYAAQHGYRAGTPADAPRCCQRGRPRLRRPRATGALRGARLHLRADALYPYPARAACTRHARQRRRARAVACAACRQT